MTNQALCFHWKWDGVDVLGVGSSLGVDVDGEVEGLTPLAPELEGDVPLSKSSSYGRCVSTPAVVSAVVGVDLGNVNAVAEVAVPLGPYDLVVLTPDVYRAVASLVVTGLSAAKDVVRGADY